MDAKPGEIHLNFKINLLTNTLKNEISKLHIYNNNSNLVHKNEIFIIVNLIAESFYSIFDYIKNSDDKLSTVKTLVNSLISNNVIVIFDCSLNQLFDMRSNTDMDYDVKMSISKSMEILMDILRMCSECSREFGDGICRRDKLINLFIQILNQNQGNYQHDSLSKVFYDTCFY